MEDREKPVHEEVLAVGRGIVYGILFGVLIWAVIIGGIYIWLNR